MSELNRFFEEAGRAITDGLTRGTEGTPLGEGLKLEATRRELNAVVPPKVIIPLPPKGEKDLVQYCTEGRNKIKGEIRRYEKDLKKAARRKSRQGSRKGCQFGEERGLGGALGTALCRGMRSHQRPRRRQRRGHNHRAIIRGAVGERKRLVEREIERRVEERLELLRQQENQCLGL